MRAREAHFSGVRPAAVSDAGAPSDKIYEAIKVRSAEFGQVLEIEDTKFKLVDMIDLIDEGSEKSHKFTIEQARDRYRTRQRLKYPDGVTHEDVGVAYEGGYAEWEIDGVLPKRDVIMVTRTDCAHMECCDCGCAGTSRAHGRQS